MREVAGREVEEIGVVEAFGYVGMEEDFGVVFVYRSGVANVFLMVEGITDKAIDIGVIGMGIGNLIDSG